MNVTVVAIRGIIFSFIQDSFVGVVEVAVELHKIALAGRNGAEKGADLASPRDLLDKSLRIVFVNFFEHAVKVGGDGRAVKEFWQ